MIAVEWARAPGVPLVGEPIATALGSAGSDTLVETRTDRIRLVGGHSPPELAPVPSGQFLALFAGHIDNAGELAGQLGLPAPRTSEAGGLARLYARAAERWGRDADLRVIGEYSAILFDPVAQRLRLSRSPLRAPPLHYHADRNRVIAASVVRAIFACGIEARLNQAKLADHALFNFSGEANGWYQGMFRVPLGSVVEFTPDRETCHRYYDFASIPRVPKARIADHVAQAAHLFTEATRAALNGCERPAVMLSGGLDSALVAAKALELSPSDRSLDAFCFVPGADWDGFAPLGRYGNERPLVEDLARMHPRLRPQFFDNPERRLDDDFAAIFGAIGAAPINLVNLSAYHPMWRAARAAGCDRILVGEFGNTTLSNAGDWGFSEMFTRLRWIRLADALRHSLDDDRPLWRRFIGAAALPLVPDWLWHWQREIRGRIDIFESASPLRRDYAATSGALDRASAAGLPIRRHPVRDRMADFTAIHHEAWGEQSDIEHGFAQIYGIEQRDPMAWRPLVEYCAGLPTEMFLNGGESRWLARELGREVLPDSIRLNRQRGLHHADWHSRLGRQRERLLALLRSMERIPRLAEMIDFARIRPALENWPASSAIPDSERLTLEAALPRAILIGRFVAWAEGIALE